MDSSTALRTRALIAFLGVLLPACSYLPEMPSIGSIKPYRIDIQQGNFLSQEKIVQLKPGMTREQVRFLLGSPLVTDIFHANRWDYVFYRERPGNEPERRNISIIFEKDRLARVTGDVKAADGAARAVDAPNPNEGKASNPKAEAKH